MDESAANETTLPDLKDLEGKIGRKTPEGLLRWMREEASSHRGDAKLSAAHDTSKQTGRKSLDEKIRKLKADMAHLRSVDVKILQQLLAVHEGIEAVKWLLEERSTLTSRCSSLTSSQYSLGEGPDTSWRGSWSSLQDPNEKLDNISIGSYLDTLADDLDEYCPSSSESVICSTTPLVSEGTLTGGRRGGGAAGTVTSAGSGAGEGVGSSNGAGSKVKPGENENGIESGSHVKAGVTSLISGFTGTEAGKPAIPVSSPQAKSDGAKQDAPVRSKGTKMSRGGPVSKSNTQTQAVKCNGVREKPIMQIGHPSRPSLSERVGSNQSPKLKPYKNGKIDLDTCKMNGKKHLEYDTHWKWVQSQEDVTFL